MSTTARKRKLRTRTLLALIALIAAAPVVRGMPESAADTAQSSIFVADASRIVSIGGAVTEIVYALGFGSNLVGVDTSSLYPEDATRLPRWAINASSPPREFSPCVRAWSLRPAMQVRRLRSRSYETRGSAYS